VAKRQHFDVAILGGGSAGCVLASRLSEDESMQVCLVEAGPDYGPYAAAGWPPDLLDASADALISHDWGYAGGVASARARVIGGCSAINGCGIVWPTKDDLDSWWPEFGWNFATMAPYLRRAEQQMRSRLSSSQDLEPWRRAFLEAALASGYVFENDFNNSGFAVGVGLATLNTVGRVRWNASFAYLDQARSRANLTLMPNTFVDSISIKGERAASARLVEQRDEVQLHADRFVVAAGTFASPGLLERSGIGDPTELARLRIHASVALRGVGDYLVDHPLVDVPLHPRPDLLGATRLHFDQGHPQAQVLMKSPDGRHGTESWDLMLGPWLGPYAGITVTQTSPQATGQVRQVGSESERKLRIEHSFAQPTMADLASMISGVEVAIELSANQACAKFADLDAELDDCRRSGRLAEWIRPRLVGNHHPVGTCRMGPVSDSSAVVDATARVHGIDNLYVVDASIFPSIPRANVHLTVLGVAERMAALLAGKERREA
jgi:choline dehydrogenase